MPQAVQISAIVPVGARQSPIREIYDEYVAGLSATGQTFEIVFVLDGRYPEVAAALELLARADERVRVVALSKSFGESTALMAGFEQAKAAIILTLPAYFQIPGDGIRTLLAGLDAADVVVAHRQQRAGGVVERLRRSAYHGLAGFMTGLKLRDLGCSARAMRRCVLEEISLYGDQHRLLPALADRQGFHVSEVDVPQSPLDRFTGHYRARDYLHRLLDIFTVFFLVRFTKKPLRFFGMLGAVTVAIGSLLLLYLAVDRLGFGHSIADRPLLLLSSLLVVLGTQIFAMGLLGELMIFTHARGLKDY
jgi:glycosyltransferase involved in cell wall biosynthesis